jgi:hypothetical protein
MIRRVCTLAVATALLALAHLGSAGARPSGQVVSCAAANAGCWLTLPRVGAPPLSDAAAARLVHRSRWEPRPENYAANHRVPSSAALAYFRSHSEMPYKDQVTGAFTGTTDEIIQWAAYKHGLDPNLLRAVAAVESWWNMSTVGAEGESFGLFQLRSPYQCCNFLAAGDTAFNADYYAAILRAYYDGRETWLNSVTGNGAPYRPGDLWGSVGAWFSGRWHDPGAEGYIAKVKLYLRLRVWRQHGF